MSIIIILVYIKYAREKNRQDCSFISNMMLCKKNIDNEPGFFAYYKIEGV
jgi:hypothetical protein